MKKQTIEHWAWAVALTVLVFGFLLFAKQQAGIPVF